MNISIPTWRTKPAQGLGGHYHEITGTSNPLLLVHASEGEANLMAAAPDLLMALNGLLRSLEAVDAVADFGPELAPGIYQASRAITKATGGVA